MTQQLGEGYLEGDHHLLGMESSSGFGSGHHRRPGYQQFGDAPLYTGSGYAAATVSDNIDALHNAVTKQRAGVQGDDAHPQLSNLVNFLTGQHHPVPAGEAETASIAAKHGFDSALVAFHNIMSYRIGDKPHLQWKNLPPTLVSVGIGAPATIAYIEPGKEIGKQGLPPFPGGTTVNPVLNPLSSVVLNAGINIYFFNQVILPGWNSLFNYPSDPGANDALNRLKNLDMNTAERVKRTLKGLGIIALVLTPAVASALPTFLMDRRKTNHPLWLSSMIFADFTIMSINGVRIIAFKYGPKLLHAIGKPFINCYYNHHPQQKILRELLQKMDDIKSAHVTVLSAAKNKLLDWMQRGNNDLKLQDFYALQALLDDGNTGPEQRRQLATAFHLALCRLVSHDQALPHSRAHSYGRMATQVVGALGNLLSLPGYYLETVYGVADIVSYYSGNDMTSAGKFALGSALFLTPTALFTDVVVEIIGAFYDTAGHAGKGYYHAYRNGKLRDKWADDAVSRYQFAKYVKDKMVRLPLSAQQHPAIILPILYILQALTYWTSSTTLALNYDHLTFNVTQAANATQAFNSTQPATYEVASHFNVPSIIFGMLFNMVAISPILYAIYRGLVIVNGSANNQKQLRLIMAVEKMMQDVSAFDSKQFLQLLHDITTLSTGNEPGDRELAEAVLTEMLKLTPNELLGDDFVQEQLLLNIDNLLGDDNQNVNWVNTVQALREKAVENGADFQPPPPKANNKKCCPCWPRNRGVNDTTHLLGQHGHFGSVNSEEGDVEMPLSSSSRGGPSFTQTGGVGDFD